MVPSDQNDILIHKNIQSNESTLILGACRVVKSTFEIIVEFLKEKVRFFSSVRLAVSINTHGSQARVMFSTLEKLEMSSLNGLNSFRTCLIALVEYAMVSAFIFLCILSQFTLFTGDGSAKYVHSR